MILKVRDTEFFNLSLKLIINYELEYIELIVQVKNKLAHTGTMKTFSAGRLSEALAYYSQQEHFFFGKTEE